MDEGGKGRRDPPLIERDAEIERITKALEAARQGSGETLVIEAPAGLGKSSLLRYAASQVGEEIRVLSARGGGSAEAVDFGVALRLLSPLVEDLDQDRRESVFSGHAARARALIEGAETFAPGEPADATPLLVGLTWLTARLAREPLLIAIDDAHAVDLPTLSYLVHLEQMIGDLPIALLIAARPATEAARQRLLARLSAAPTATRIGLEALSEGGVAELVGATAAEAATEFSAAVAETSGGNPLLVCELLREAQRRGLDAGDPSCAAAVATLVPEGVAINVAGRIAELPPECERLCRAVAVIGDGATLAEASHVSEIEIEPAAVGADLLAREELLLQRKGLEFAHPLVRSAVEAGLPPGAAALLHRRAAEMFRRSLQMERVPLHLQKAPAAGEPWVVEVLRDAARRSLAHADPATAVSFLRRALEEPPDPEMRAAVLAELAHAEVQAGEPTALERFDLALEMQDDERERAGLLLARGQAAYRLGRLEEAARDFDRGLTLIDAGSDLGMRLESEYSQVATLIPQLAVGVPERMERAIAAMEGGPAGPGARSLLATASLNHGLWGTRRERVRDLAERALADGGLIADAVGGGNALFSVTASLTWAESYDRVIEVADQAASAAAQRGAVLCWVTCNFCRGLPNLMAGRLRDAVADCEIAVAGEARGWEQFLPAAHAWRAYALIELGELDAAERGIAELAPELWGVHPTWPLIDACRGRLLLEHRKPEAALACFERWGERWPVPNPAAYAAWRSQSAFALIQIGDKERAAALAADELDAARGFGAPAAIGRALHALGLARGGTEGLDLLREAVADLDRSPAKLLLAHALGDLGAALRRDNRKAAAREPLKRALDLAERMGAKPLATRVREELSMTGARPRSPWSHGVEALTAGELRVARMAASEMSNREIAEALFVTDRAVHWHLRNTYRKLGVNDRSLLSGLLGSEAPAKD